MIFQLLIVGFVQAQRFLQADSTCYGVILDCGSSSTKTTIYQWPCRREQIYPQTNISQQAQSLKTSPGIATKYPDEIETYLAPIFDFINTNVPSNQKEYTPIFMGATAGMRLLDINKQNAIVDQVRIIFANSGYLFEQPSWARVISGQDESTYLWLTVKYLLNNTDANIITIDLGGASTQIAFPISYTEYDSDINIITLNGNTIDLYSISYLGFGNDQARDAILAYTISGTITKTPCYHSGYSGTWTFNSVTYTITGTGDFTTCRSLIQNYLGSTCRTVNDTLCGINGIVQPALPTSTSQIYAVSGVATIASFLGFTTFILPDFLTSAQTFCSLTWTQVQANSTYKANSYVGTNYFLSLYTYELLSTGYNIPNNITVNASSTINSQTPTWAMAGLQYQLSLTDCNKDSSVCFSNLIQILVLIFMFIQ